MRKITSFLSLSLFVAAAMNAQIDRVEAADFTPSPTNNLAPCSIEVPRDNYYGGAIESAKYASRFSVDANESFQPTNVVMVIGVYDHPGYDVNEMEYEFAIYEDLGTSGPGSALTSAISTAGSSTFLQQISLTNGSIVDLYEITVDLSSMSAIQSTPAAPSDYFFGISLTDDDDVQIGLNFTLSAVGSITFYDDGAGWTEFNASAPNDVSFTYQLNGDCNVLGVDSNVLAGVSVYPNPTSDVLNIHTPSNITVESVTLYDVLGKSVNVNFANGIVNTSSLSRGVYLLQINTNEGTLTQKIVKQ
ncbi:MAG TPA: T9SS type A sorting domain-containing protein [Flavobacteriaceae bacterium]|nr:T9SS type A sorting domain-containing protein [Flavobacteriaceae bacterium]